MPSFHDIPNELVLNIARYLVPARCEELNVDIFAFRAVERRVRLVTNDLAFERITLFLQDSTRCLKFRNFCRMGSLDAAGRDMRKYVKEVRFFSAPCIHMPSDYSRGGKLYQYGPWKGPALQNFRKILKLEEDQDLEASSTAAFKHFWELCIQSYRSCSGDVEFPRDGFPQTLAHLTNLTAVSIDSDHHYPDTSSPAWRALQEFGIIDQVYDKQRKCFLPPPENNTGPFTPNPIVYKSFGAQVKLAVLRALPISVTKLSCDHIGQESMRGDTLQNSVLRHITYFDICMDRSRFTSDFRHFRDMTVLLPNLKTLRLTTYPEKQRLYSVWRDPFSVNFHVNNIPKIVRYIADLQYLETFHVDGHIVDTTAIMDMIEYAADRHLTLVLENIMILRAVQLHLRPCYMYDICDYWISLARLARRKFPDYMSSGRVQLRGALICVSVDDTDRNVFEHTLFGRTRDIFQSALQSADKDETFRTEATKWTSLVEVQKTVNEPTAEAIKDEGPGDLLLVNENDDF